MTDYIFAFLIPCVFSAIALAALILTGHKTYSDRRPVIGSGLIQAAGFEIATLVLKLWSNLDLWEDHVIPLLPLVSVSLVTTVCITLSVIATKDNIRKLFRIAGYSAFALLMAECLIFNAKSISFRSDHLIRDNITLTGITSLEEDSSQKYILADDGIVIFGKTYLVYDNLPGTARYITVTQDRQESPDNRAFVICAEIKDSSMSDSFMTIGSKRSFGYLGRSGFAVKPAESGFTLGISLDPAKNSGFAYDTSTIEAGNKTAPLVISSVSLWDSAPYEFMVSRIIILWLITVLVASVILLRFYKTEYDRTNPRHRIVIELVVLACAASTFLVQGPDKNIVQYPLTESVDYYDIYVQTFDAFQKGQFNIDFEPPAGLSSINNPYDFSERNAAGLEGEFLWDRAYYNGKYYSYFGAAPIFTNYYPVYWVTGSIPTCDTVIAINGALASLFLALALLAVIRIYCPKAKLLLVITCLLTTSVLSYIPILMNYGYMYNVACVTAMMFLGISLWSGFTATLSKGAAKYILYIISGLSLGLCAGSRPIIAVGAAIMLPRFISILIDRDQKISSRLIQALSFAVPVTALVCLILYYNYARFGSPMDFGAAYQLTVGDIHNMKLIPSAFPLSFYYFFLIPPDQIDLFPYINLSNKVISNSEAYRYTVMNTGLFNFPYILLAYILAVPAFFKSGKKVTPVGPARSYSIERKALIAISFVLPVIIAWAVYCMAGACFRYTADITILVMCGCALMMVSCPSDRKMRYTAIIMAAAISAAAMWLLVIYFNGVGVLSEGDNFRTNFPNAVEYIEKLLIFWH